ncbi:hypothetical protein B0H19DRAFT_1257302 [Mycena capillaripes]|nr:hypothetical protein B0H19DRAFT_1257302 [Mycena capillaripes]
MSHESCVVSQNYARYTSDLSITAKIRGPLLQAGSTAAALASSSSRRSDPSSNANSKWTSSRANTTISEGGGSKTSLLDKALRYLLDGDANLDRWAEEIWLMALRLPGSHWAPPRNPLSPKRLGTSKSRSPASPHPSLTPSHSPSSSHVAGATTDGAYDEENDISPPPLFQPAFYVQVWLVHAPRGHTPPLAFSGLHPSSPSYNPSGTLAESAASTVIPTLPKMQHSPSQSDSSAYSANTSTSKKKWWPLGNVGIKGWSSDAEWECMLKTSQSLLASALARVGEPPLIPALAPPFPPRTRYAHALHARLLSLFLDAPAAPLVVHRMALAGNARGRTWGCASECLSGHSQHAASALPSPSTECSTKQKYSRGVVFPGFRTFVVICGVRHGHSSSSHGSGSKKGKESKKWGDRPVQLLLAIRLGLDCVNPIYYETIKSVGMAGGRPSSSNYFMDDSLFYLDPHHSRPAVPLRPFAAEPAIFVITRAPLARATIAVPQAACARGGSMSPESGHRHGFARGGSLSLELVYARGGFMCPDFGYIARGQAPMAEDELVVMRPSGEAISPMEETYFAQAHSAAEMRIFHCEQVRPLGSGRLRQDVSVKEILCDKLYLENR